MISKFIDTSAILNGINFNDGVISSLTLIELEHIKTDKNKTEDIRAAARNAIRSILFNNVAVLEYNEKKIKKIKKRYNFLLDINDHYMICEAELLGEQNNCKINFYTSDGAQYIIAQQMPFIIAHFYENKTEVEDEYCGWKSCYPNDIELASLYAHPEENILNLKINEYAKIFVDDKLVDIEVWNGERYKSLSYKEVRNKFLNETIKPLNVEQKMAFDLLQNRHSTVKLLTGRPGSGKDLLMIYHALDLIQKGDKDKIIFIRNLVPFKDAPEIGFLSGNEHEKISWGMGPIRSALTEEGLTQYEEQGLIEAVNLGFVRGCQYNNSIILVSEGQNITGGGYKLLISRCGPNSEIWINGDILQTDHKKFEENNGILRLINSLKGNKLFGMVKLMKTERSETAELAAQIK